MINEARPPRISSSPRVAVVGPCASGKSTLVTRLREHGYDAFAVAQEHSAVPALWAHQHPDVVIGLIADLETIRARRGTAWSEAIYRAQMDRLQAAYDAAHVSIDTREADEREMVRRAIAFLEAGAESGS
jgi:GTPase SAR1 family protein